MHINCPHCQNPIEVVDPPPPGEILCPSCGSSFHMEGRATAGASLRPGQRDLGKFELLDIVGIGAFGTVYKARDPELDRIVAIKVPRAGNLGNKEDADRFMREARSVAQLRHPIIVPVYEAGQADSMPFLVSEFVEGVTLADLLTARRPTFREAAQLIASLADALHYAHQQGVVHRDVKPSNVMLSSVVTSPSSVARRPDASPNDHGPRTTDYGQPKLMDFGLAKRDAGEITMTMDGQVLGTPAYMSPEQAKGEAHAVDGRSDVYSLGVILYELLTCELPFRGNKRMLLHQVLHDEPRPPRRVNDHIPRDLETICLKAMAKEPGRRYVSAADLSADLRRYLEGRPIEARPVGQAERFLRWCRRNPVVAGLLAAVALSLVSGTAVASYFAIQADVRAREADKNAADTLREKQRADDKAAEADAKAAEAFREKERADDKAAEAMANEEKAIRRLYISDMRLAQRAWDDAQIGRLLELLEGQRPERTGGIDLRGFEWHYWWRLCHWDLHTLKGHGGWVSCVAYSPDGRRIVSGSPDTTVKVWDAGNGQKTLILKGHTGWVTSVAYSPDGKRIVSGSYAPKLLDARTGNAISPSPSGIDKTLKVWDAQTGVEILTLKGQTTGVGSVAFSPDGSRIISGGEDGVVKVWDGLTGQEALTLRGYNTGIRGLAYSPDGKRIVSSSFHTLKVWDCQTGQELLTLQSPNGPHGSVAYSPDGKWIVGSNDKTIEVWDAQTGQETRTLKGHTSEVMSVAYSPDGRRIVSGSRDNTLKVWHAATGQDIITLKGHTGAVLSVSFSNDGKRIVSGSWDDTLKVWDAQVSQEPVTIEAGRNGVTSLAYSPEGKRIVSAGADNNIIVWDAATGEESLNPKGHSVRLKGHKGRVRSVAYSPDGKRIASGSADNAVKIWDAHTRQETLTLKGHIAPVTSVAYSPDCKRIVSGSQDHTLRVWDAATGQEILTLKGHAWQVFSVAYSPAGERIVSGSEDGTIKVWDAATGQETLTLKGHTGWVTSVAYSPDGNRILSSSQDNTIKVWNAATGQETRTLKGHTNAVKVVGYSPDGKWIVSGSDDGTIKVWDAATGQETLTLKGHTKGVNCAAFSPHGKRIISGSDDGSIKIWDASPVDE